MRVLALELLPNIARSRYGRMVQLPGVVIWSAKHSEVLMEMLDALLEKSGATSRFDGIVPHAARYRRAYRLRVTQGWHWRKSSGGRRGMLAAEPGQSHVIAALMRAWARFITPPMKNRMASGRL